MIINEIDSLNLIIKKKKWVLLRWKYRNKDDALREIRYEHIRGDITSPTSRRPRRGDSSIGVGVWSEQRWCMQARAPFTSMYVSSPLVQKLAVMYWTNCEMVALLVMLRALWHCVR